MNFLWSSSLYLFALIPLFVVAYIWLLRRRRRFAVRYSSLSLVREAAAHQSWVRKHLPFVLFLLVLSSLTVAFARPVATVTVPSNKATVILALDVSRSMCSTDISPNRLEAAKQAALSFVHRELKNRQIGVVAFAGFAELIQPPTNDPLLLETAIDSLTPGRRTAIGSAILRSIDAIAEVDSHVSASDVGGATSAGGTTNPPPANKYVPHIIILLTDGASNAGPSPLSAAQEAAARGIRVYTIGFGTTQNSSAMNCGDQFFQPNDQFGGGFGPQFSGNGGRPFRLEIDEETLNAIADSTGASYHAATSAEELNSVFASLPIQVIATKTTTEISAFFTAFAALLAVIAIALSFVWHPLG